MRRQAGFWRIAGCSALLAASLPGGVGLAAEEKRRFDIPAGEAARSLNEWAARASLYLIAPYATIRDLTTNEVHGEFAPEEALRRMVLDTGIVCRVTKPRTMWCERPQKKPASSGARVGPQTQNAEIPRARPPEVTVTGTPIRGNWPVGAQHQVFSREDIERSGVATLPDFIRTLPQNFGGGPTDDTRIIGRETRTNSGLGAALNLRGIGPGETLVLLNGRRLAPGGTEGAFIDITSIPLTAVDHIEMLPDGGSALYGADAIGAVLNIVLRRDYSGFESQARAGTATRGGPREFQVGQALGSRSQTKSTMLAFEFYQRDALPTQDRSRARSDLRPFGGDNFDVFQSNPGTIIAGGVPWAIPTGQDGTALKAGDLVEGTPNLEDRYRGADLTAFQKRWSAVGSAQRSLGENVHLFGDALITRRDAQQKFPGARSNLPVPSSNPFYVNPAGGEEPIIVSYDFSDDLGPLKSAAAVDTSNIAFGADLDTHSGWRLSAYAGHARETLDAHLTGQTNFAALMAALMDPNPRTAFNPFGDGSHTNPATLAAIRAESFFSSTSSLSSLNVTGDGTVAQLPGGALKLALGADYRHLTFGSTLEDNNVTSPSNITLGRGVAAAFGELLIPLARSEGRRRGLRELLISLAARYEDHADVGSTAAPKFGLRWSPMPGLTLRGTWAKSFRTPNLADLYEGNNVSGIIALGDPSSPSRVTQTLVWTGKNAALRPESARSWTLGVELGARRLAGWSMAATYFDVRLRNQFTETPFDLDGLTDPRFENFIIRNPSLEQRQTLCGRSRFVGTPGACLNAPIGAIVDARLNNSAFMATSGLDLTGHREFATASARFELDMTGTYVFRYAERETPNSPLLDRADTQNNPLRLRLRGSFSWQRRQLGATAGINHDGGYRDIASGPPRAVDSWTTCDLQLRYDVTDGEGGWLGNTRFSLNAQNLFDQDPPFLNNRLGFGYDAENADLLGRRLNFEVRKAW